MQTAEDPRAGISTTMVQIDAVNTSHTLNILASWTHHGLVVSISKSLVTQFHP